MTPQFHVMRETPYSWKPDMFGPYSEGEAQRVMAGLVRLAPGRVFEVWPAGSKS